MKKLAAFKATAAGGMALMIAAIIMMFAYTMVVGIPEAHLGFLAILGPIIPFMVQIAFIMLIIGFVLFFIGLIMSLIKGK